MIRHRPPVVVVGASHWHTPRHLEALTRAEIPVVALSDARAEHAAGWGERLGAEAFGDWQQMLERHPGAVPLVLTEHDDAPPILEWLASRGRPFALEKPGTTDAMALAALERFDIESLPTAVALVNRYSPFWARVAELGLSTEWRHAHFRILGGPPQRYLDDDVAWVLDPVRAGGGALRNLGIHAADAAVELLGGPLPVEVATAHTSNHLHGRAVEDYACATLVAADGRTITVEAGYALPHEAGSDKEWRVHGPQATVIERRGQLSSTTADGLRTEAAPTVMKHYARFAEDVAGLAEGRSGAATVQDLHRAQQVIDLIYANAVGSTAAGNPPKE